MASGAPPAWPPGPSGAWNQALAVMAAHPRPETLPPDVYLRHDEHTLTIYDGYPKAKYHFLILRESGRSGAHQRRRGAERARRLR